MVFGFFALLLAIAGLGLVRRCAGPTGSRARTGEAPSNRLASAPSSMLLLGAYALALLSLLLRPRKVLGFDRLVVALAATLLGGAGASRARRRTGASSSGSISSSSTWSRPG